MKTLICSGSVTLNFMRWISATDAHACTSRARRCDTCSANLITVADYTVSLKASHSLPPTTADVIVACQDCHEDKYASVRRQMKSDRLLVWLHHQGRQATGPCHACGFSMHVNASFHKGHDIAHALGGDMSLSNIRPVHAHCNQNMGTHSFQEYHRKLGIKAPTSAEMSVQECHEVAKWMRTCPKRRNVRERPSVMGQKPVPQNQSVLFPSSAPA